MDIDYTIFYKKKFVNVDEFVKNKSWNLFISAYNDSERVRKLFSRIKCDDKHWLILPDYGYASNEFPKAGKVYAYPKASEEHDFILSYVNDIQLDLSQIDFCIDVTGFMRPHLIFLIRFLKELNVKKFDVIYTDPDTYAKKEKTTFTKDNVYHVRQIAGCEGAHSTDSSNDVLIIGSGYDDKLIARVAESKAKAKKIQVFGFPSLQPDMYQENLLRAYKAEEALGGQIFLDQTSCYHAPANDPFVTASVIHDLVNRENERTKITNLYLSPLSTKAQTLGFVLYYLWECLDKSASIIFPFCTQYTRETTKGISRVWLYTVELP